MADAALPLADVPLLPPGTGARGHTISRRLQRQTILCPGGCGKNLQLSSAAYSHRCKRPRPEPSADVVEERLRKMTARAVQKFACRAAACAQEGQTEIVSPVNATEAEGSTDEPDNLGRADAPGSPRIESCEQSGGCSASILDRYATSTLTRRGRDTRSVEVGRGVSIARHYVQAG